MYKPVDGMITNAQFIARVIENASTIPFIGLNNGKHERLANIPCGFDIETSSFYIGSEKYSLMYEWTFGMGEYITYGRTWDSFVILLRAVSQVLALNDRKRLVVYVHNLPYEFQFMRKHFTWSKVFFLEERKPVYAITDFGVEFRCSLKLSNKSLAATANDLLKYPVKKMVGDLDYSKIRHSRTPMTAEELKYCENDVRVILNYIQEKIESDGGITHIPLTNTGYVRRYCKNACFPEIRVSEDTSPYDLDEIGAIGVSRAERVFSRWLHARECPPSREFAYEGVFVRLYEFLSRRYDSREVSNIVRCIPWLDDNGGNFK